LKRYFPVMWIVAWLYFKAALIAVFHGRKSTVQPLSRTTSMLLFKAANHC